MKEANAEEFDDGCICYGNWRAIVKAMEPFLGQRFIEKRTRAHYTFFGLVHARDDYYYGLCRDDNKCVLLSCVSSIEGHGFTLLSLKKKGKA